MGKILMWNTYKLKSSGGPAGYLYNIQQYVKSREITKIVFLNIFSKLFKMFSSHLYINFTFCLKVNSLYKKDKLNIIFDEYDYIHFHSTWELFKARSIIKKFNGKIILTSHSPVVYHKELIESFNYKNLCRLLVNKLEKIDVYAFSEADLVFFPTKYSMEPYYNSWLKFEKILNNKKIIYIPTGIPIPPRISKEKNKIFNGFQIPDDLIVVSYIGRHNRVKGYDILLEFGTIILNKYKNVLFLIAGNEVPLKGLSHQRWIELGWIENPSDIMSNTDIFILPNRQTYFDLVLLEVMSYNKHVLLSDTGGNKYFTNLKNDMHFFESENVENMVEIFDEYIRKRHDEYIVCNNRKVIEDNFSIDVFVTNYIKSLYCNSN